MLPNVSYQPAERQYQVVDPDTGDCEFFPAGRDGRREAHHRAVQLVNPRLHRIVCVLVARYPQLESRAWRAAELVVNDDVSEVDEPGVQATVTGNSEYGDYLITVRDGLIVCDCLDYLEGGAPFIDGSGQRLCKHILATQFCQRLRTRICGSCGSPAAAELMDCPACNGAVTPF